MAVNRKDNSSPVGCLYIFAIIFTGIATFLFCAWLVPFGRVTTNGIVAAFVCLVLAAFFWWSIPWYRRRKKEELEFRQQHPDEPWLWNERWNNGKIRGMIPPGFGIAWSLAILFCGSWAFMFFRGSAHDDLRSVFVVFVFPVVGLGCLVRAIFETVRLIRFGVSTLELATFPVPVGGQLVGTIYVRRKLSAAGDYRLRLRCVDRADVIWEDRVLWKDQAVINPLAAEETFQMKTVIPVGFVIPEHVPPSDDTDRDVIWELQVEAKLPGLDYRAAFRIPVYRLTEAPQDVMDI